MSDVAERLRGMVRWSMAARCSRMASYGLLGVDPKPPTPREQGRFARGRDTGHYIARQLKAKYGDEDVVSEMAVPWPAPPAMPIGELHIDAAILSERIGVEVKSTEWVDSLYDSAVLQIAGAVHWSEHLDSGLVIIVDRDYQITHEFPVFLTDELIEQVEEIAAAVIEAGQGGFSALPPRICEKPSDGIGHFCPFIETCFQGWEEPPPVARDDLSALASEGWLIYRDLKAAKGQEKELQARWDEWKAHALEAFTEKETDTGPVKVKRTDRRGSHSFSLAKAKTAGVWQSVHDEIFAAFISQNSGSTTFDLVRQDGDLDLDFGDASHLDALDGEPEPDVEF